MVRAWAELCLGAVAAAWEAVARLEEAAGRRVVAGHAEAYRADDPETIAVDEAAEAVGGVRPIWEAQGGFGSVSTRSGSCIPCGRLGRGTTRIQERPLRRPRCDSMGVARRERYLPPR